MNIRLYIKRYYLLKIQRGNVSLRNGEFMKLNERQKPLIWKLLASQKKTLSKKITVCKNSERMCLKITESFVNFSTSNCI